METTTQNVWFIGFRDITPITENQMDKNVDNGMQTRVTLQRPRAVEVRQASSPKTLLCSGCQVHDGQGGCWNHTLSSLVEVLK